LRVELFGVLLHGVALRSGGGKRGVPLLESLPEPVGREGRGLPVNAFQAALER